KYGGISFVNGFTDPYPNVSYVFPANLSGGDPKKVGEATSHEAGHGFGLQHQSVYDGTTKLLEYNPGTPAKAPVMGRSYDAQRGLWWTGQSIVFSQIQHDPYVLWGT